MQAGRGSPVPSSDLVSAHGPGEVTTRSIPCFPCSSRAGRWSGRSWNHRGSL